MLELNCLAMEEEKRAGRSVSPELLAQAARLRARSAQTESAETEREYAQLMRRLARKHAEMPDLVSALRAGHGP